MKRFAEVCRAASLFLPLSTSPTPPQLSRSWSYCRINPIIPDMAEFEYHPYYLQGIEYFNECDFYEAHEVWEALWTDYQGPSRKFFQGLIQVAVGLHHFGNGNIHGAKKLFATSRKYLEPYRPDHMGCNLEKLLAEMDRCFAEVNAADEQFPEIEIDPELIPEIHLDPPPPVDWKKDHVPFERYHEK